MLKPGDSLDFSASPPYSVVVGRADAVQVTVRGQSFDVMPLARNSVARFQVK
jgi:cytoskeleton protein RodZ